MVRPATRKRGRAAATEDEPAPADVKHEPGAADADWDAKPDHKRAKSSTADAHAVLEKGHVFFFYRPRVDVDEVTREADLQRLYIELVPAGTVRRRLILVPRKHLPRQRAPDEPHRGRPDTVFAFVDTVAASQDELNEYLGRQTYQTKTRGERTLHACRCVGEGTYEIVMHHRHPHLVYVLTDPVEPGDAQLELNIVKEGSFVVQVRNPERPPGRARTAPGRYPEGFGGLGEKEHAHYSDELQQQFRSKVDPSQQVQFASNEALPQMLDEAHSELLLIAASGDIVKELEAAGEAVRREAEHEVQLEHRRGESPETHVRKELHLQGESAQGQGKDTTIDTAPVSTGRLE